MWIANGWKEYEVIDTSSARNWSDGGIYPCPSGSAGNLGYTKDRARMAQDERHIITAAPRAAVNGSSLICPSSGIFITRTYVPSETISASSTPDFSRSRQRTGTGLATRSVRRQTDQGSESVCLYRWCNSCSGGSRCIRYTCRCL